MVTSSDTISDSINIDIQPVRLLQRKLLIVGRTKNLKSQIHLQMSNTMTYFKIIKKTTKLKMKRVQQIVYTIKFTILVSN